MSLPLAQLPRAVYLEGGSDSGAGRSVRPHPPHAMDSFGLGESDSTPPERQRSSGGFSREIVDDVWLSADPIEGNDEALWRVDEHGDWIQRHDYGKRNSSFGWEITEDASGSLKPIHCRHISPGEPGSADDEEDGGLSADTFELF